MMISVDTEGAGFKGFDEPLIQFKINIFLLKIVTLR